MVMAFFAYCILQYVSVESPVPLSLIVFQSPGFGWSLFEVNVIVLFSSPIAERLPSTFSEKSPPNLTSTPGSIVNVAVG